MGLEDIPPKIFSPSFTTGIVVFCIFPRFSLFLWVSFTQTFVRCVPIIVFGVFLSSPSYCLFSLSAATVSLCSGFFCGSPSGALFPVLGRQFPLTVGVLLGLRRFFGSLLGIKSHSLGSFPDAPFFPPPFLPSSFFPSPRLHYSPPSLSFSHLLGDAAFSRTRHPPPLLAFLGRFRPSRPLLCATRCIPCFPAAPRTELHITVQCGLSPGFLDTPCALA